jgi:hypothetical protein
VEKQKEKILIPGPVEKLIPDQYCFKPAAAANRICSMKFTNYLSNFLKMSHQKLTKTIASSNQCCVGIRNGNPSLVKISSDFPNVF